MARKRIDWKMLAMLGALVGALVAGSACNGGDDVAPPAPPKCADKDGDGYATCSGTCDSTGLKCGDCNDQNASLNVDCGGGPCADQDGDGYVDTSGNCTVPSGLKPGDCNDADRLMNPGAVEGHTARETCLDKKDNNCNAVRDGAEPACTYEMTISNQTRGPLYPPLVRGDREFDGHGPRVEMTARLESTGTKARVTVTMRAEETVANQTLGQGSATYDIWTARSGEKIVRLISDTESSCSAVDTDHSWDYCYFSSSELVNRFDWVGDTSGDDICVGDSCTQVITHLNPVRLAVRIGE